MRQLTAILWDFDGTLVSSLNKNFTIIKEIMGVVREDYKVPENLPLPLQNFEQYKKVTIESKNWRDLYMNHFGLSLEETNAAGSLWSEYQDKNKTPVELFEELPEIISALSDVPHGVCSQNSANFISSKLQEYDVLEHFHGIIGYNDISYEFQKPHPLGFISCLDKFPKKIVEGTILYIGDHEQDVIFANNAKQALTEAGLDNIDVVSVAANYEFVADISHWPVKPDHVANSVSDLLDIANIYSDVPIEIKENTLRM